MCVCCTFHPLGLDVVEVLAQREVPDGAVLGQPHQQGGQIHVQTYKHTTSSRLKSRRLSASRECSPCQTFPPLSEMSRLVMLGISATQPSRIWEPPERSLEQKGRRVFNVNAVLTSSGTL